MKKHVVHIFMVACAFYGCAQREEIDSVSERVNATIQDIGRRLSSGGTGLGSGVEFGNINAMFGCVSSTQRRIQLANTYAAKILSVDLVGQEYRQRENATRLYFDYVKHCFLVLKNNGASPSQAIDFFFSGLEKYRESCLGVSLASRGAEECQDVFRYRRSCARSLFDDYEQTMSEIKRFWLPRLATRFPEELHDEFRRRIEPFFDFPSKQEMLNAPYYLIHCRLADWFWSRCGSEYEAAAMDRAIFTMLDWTKKDCSRVGWFEAAETIDRYLQTHRRDRCDSEKSNYCRAHR